MNFETFLEIIVIGAFAIYAITQFIIARQGKKNVQPKPESLDDRKEEKKKQKLEEYEPI